MRFSFLFFLFFFFSASSGSTETYKWVDEKGTVHFADDLSTIPEQYRPDTEIRKTPKESTPVEIKERRTAPVAPKASESEGIEVALLRKHELMLAEVLLNERVKRYFIIDTGASFTLINRQTARELEITVDGSTPFIPIFTASDMILAPMVTLRSVRVGTAEVENVDVLIHNMPTDTAGLLGNSFLNRFKVVLDSIQEKMTLFTLQGNPSPDRPGGYSRDFWTGQFRFYHQTLAEMTKLRARYEKQGNRSELNRVDNTIRYFENRLSELERKASFAGVPRNWRE